MTSTVGVTPSQKQLRDSGVLGYSAPSSSSGSGSYQNGELEEAVSRTSSYDSTETVDGSSETSRGMAHVLRALAFFAILGATFLLAVAMAADYPSQYIDSLTNSRLQQAETGGIAYSSLSATEKSTLFKSFKKQYGKSYADSASEDEAFDNFKDFLQLVDSRNTDEEKKGGKKAAVHGVTKFADLSESEFKRAYLTFKKNTDVTLKKFGTEAPEEALVDKKESADDRRQRRAERRALKDGNKKGDANVVNWSGVLTTPVNDQGYCGSCWAFSAVQQLESDSIRAGYMTPDDSLSVQQLVSCDTNDYGCEGGYPVYGYKFIYDNGGVVANASYPYTSYYDSVAQCESVSSDGNVVSLTDFYYFKTEAAMESHVSSTGPLSICIDASTWSSYTSGTLSTCSDHVNHCVQVVGINSDDGYWIIRNSWGTEWGEDGYIYVQTDENLCDITYLPTYVNPKKIK